jgi:hypothetical protein
MGKRTIEGKYLSSSEKILSSLVFTNQSDTIAMHAPTGNALLALISPTLVLHNAEEYLAFPRSSPLPAVDWDSKFPAAGLAERRADCRVHCSSNRAAVACDCRSLCHRKPRASGGALFIETVLLGKAVGQRLTALLLGSYLPGLVTAVVSNLPVGIYDLQPASREQWSRPNAAWQSIGVAIALHLIWHSSVASALTSSRLSDSPSCTR